MGNSSCFTGKMRRKTWWRAVAVLLILALNTNLLLGTRFAQNVLADSHKFIVQPYVYKFDSSKKEFTVIWETDFVPVSYDIERYDQESKKFVLYESVEDNVHSKEKSYTFGASAYGERFCVIAYYNYQWSDGTWEKRSCGSAEITSLGEEYSSYFSFIEQPQSGSCYTESGHSEDAFDNHTKFKISCKTAFVPKKLLIVHDYWARDGKSDWTTDKTFTHLSSTNFEYTDFVPDPKEYYNLLAYYCDDKFVASEAFQADNLGFAFTTEPQDGSLTYRESSANVDYMVEFGFTQRPLQIEVYYDDEDRAIGYPYLWETKYAIYMPGRYMIRAKFSDYCTIEKSFYVKQGDMGFDQQPEGHGYTTETNSSTGFGRFHYNFSWKTTFKPARVEIGYYTGKDWNVVKTYTDVDSSKKTVTDFSPLMDITYYVRAYYSDIGYIESDPYREYFPGLNFTKKPESGMLSEYNTFYVDWALNFHPIRLELYKYVEVPGREWGEYVLVKKINKVNDFFFLDGESGGFTLRAYFTDEYYASASFAVSEHVEFTKQPRDGRLEMYEDGLTDVPYFVPDYETSSPADNYIVWKLDSNGEPQFTNQARYSGEMPYIIGAGDYVIEAQYYIYTAYGSNGETISAFSEPFTVLPYERFESNIFKTVMLPTEDEGEISWNLNFEPLRMGARKYLEDGTFELIEFSNPSSVGTFMLPEGIYDLFAYYGDGEDFVIYSNQFTVEKFQFSMQPYFYYEDALKVWYHNTQDIKQGESDTMMWGLNAVPCKLEMIWEDEDGQTHSRYLSPTDTGYTFINNGDASTWGLHYYRLRAWLTEDEDSVIESDVCFVTLLGPAINFDNERPYDYNGGSMGYWIQGLDRGKKAMKPVYAGKGGKVTLPQCGLQPPKGKMLDHWVINNAAYYEGQEITITSNKIATPVWKDLSFSLTSGIDDYTVNDVCRISLETFLYPYIPSLWADFYYAEGESTMTIGTPPVHMEFKWIDLSTGQEWVHPAGDLDVLRAGDSDVIGGTRWFIYGPTQPGEYSLQFLYVDHDVKTIVASTSFSVTEYNVSGEHTYELNEYLDKEYDGEPVFFDPFKGLSVDGGKGNWGELEKMGDVRYEFREVVMKEKEEYTFPMDGVPVEVGTYQLVIQERDPKDKDGKLWIDAAVFYFEIYGASVTYEYVEALDPTYEAEGHLEYYFGSDGNYYIMEDGEYVVVEWEDLVLPKKEYTMVEIDSKDFNGKITPTLVRAESFTEEEFTVPTGVYLEGRTFTGWKVNDTLYTTSEEVSSAVNALVGEKPREPIMVEMVYEQKEDRYDVIVAGGTLSDSGETSGNFRSADVVMVKANEAEAGKKFSHWEKNGVLVGYDLEYVFYMPSEEVTMTAVYVEEEEQVEKSGTAYIESWKTVEENKLVFVSIISVPEGCTILKGGLVATNDDMIGEQISAESVTEVEGKKVFVKTKVDPPVDTFRYTWTKSNVQAEETWYVKAYLVYLDEEGVEHTVYGDIVEGRLEQEG